MSTVYLPCQETELHEETTRHIHHQRTGANRSGSCRVHQVGWQLFDPDVDRWWHTYLDTPTGTIGENEIHPIGKRE